MCNHNIAKIRIVNMLRCVNCVFEQKILMWHRHTRRDALLRFVGRGGWRNRPHDDSRQVRDCFDMGGSQKSRLLRSNMDSLLSWLAL